MKKLVDRVIQLDLNLWKNSPYLLSAFQMKAVLEGWSETEIELVSNQVKFEPEEKQYEILMQYCLPTIDSGVALTQSDVHFLLAHLNMETHYLGQTEIENWDEYDWSNYMHLKRRATSSIKRVYALYSDSVDAENKYKVTTKPSEYFDTYQDAQDHLKILNKHYIKIYPLWIQR